MQKYEVIPLEHTIHLHAVSGFFWCRAAVGQRRIIVPDSHDAKWIDQNTRVVLLTKSARDTVSLSSLTFSFDKTQSGKAYLYLVSPELNDNTSYKFRIRKNKPTAVDLKYAKFEQPAPRREKSPEEKQEDLAKGLLIARIAIDVFLAFKHFR